MLKNYLSITFRGLLKNKLFSFINVFGLSLSLSVCMIIIMVVAGQMSQDRHIPDHDRLYRIGSRWIENGNRSNDYATTALPLATKIKEYPGIEEAIMLRRGFGNGWVKVEQDVNIPVQGLYVDQAFLELFNYDLKYGNKSTALTEPYSAILTEETAMKLYNRVDVVGEVLEVGDLGEYTITGIVDMEGINSHIKFEALASYSTLASLEKLNIMGKETDNWDNFTAGWVYVKLLEAVTPEQVEASLAQISEKQFADDKETDFEYFLQPITAINPGPLMNNPIGPMMPMVVVYFFTGLCVIIMLTAGFNYTNLSIAKALSRAREVGVRKVSGALRRQIFGQFIIESVVIMIIAFFIGMVLLITFFKPAFEGLLFADVLHWDVSFQIGGILMCLLFAILCGALVGLLPASVLSSFDPGSAMKGLTGKKVMSKVGLRKTLLVSQFALSLIFIITMVLVERQFNLLVTSDYGFNAKDVLTLKVKEEDYYQIKTILEGNSGVVNVSAASHLPSTGNTRGETIRRELSDEMKGMDYYAVDENYLPNLEIELLAGQNFPSHLSDLKEERYVLINEEAVKFYQFETAFSAVGETLYLQDSSTVQILGVMANYHHQPMMMDVSPMLLRYKQSEFRYLQVRHLPENKNQAEKAIADAYNTIYPNKKAQIETLNGEIEEFYNIIFGDIIKIFVLFSTLAIVIASMGLLGMVTYSVQLRLKEISIRKVLGAETRQLVMTLSRGFIALLGLGIIIAIPVAYFLNNLWLQNIAVRVNMTTEVVLIGVGIIILFGIITIGSQTLRASLLNPVKFLKDE